MIKNRRRSVSPAHPHYRLARLLVEQQQWQKAINAYQEALAQAPTWVEVQQELGDLFLKLERWENAVEVYETAIALQPDLAQIHHNLGDALLKLQRYQKAVAAYQNAIELNSQFSWSYNNLGDALRELQRWEEAELAYQKAIALKADFALSHHNLGDVFVKKEAWEAAIKAYQNAIDLDPNFVWSHYNLAKSYEPLGEWEKAIDAYREALKIQPDFAEIEDRLNQALHHQVKVKLEQALHYYRLAIETDPTDIESYQKALEIHPDDVTLNLGLAKAWDQKQELEKAIEAYQQVLLLQPDLEEAQNNLEQILLTLQPCEPETEPSPEESLIWVEEIPPQHLYSIQSIDLGNDSLLVLLSGGLTFKPGFKIEVNQQEIQTFYFEELLNYSHQIEVFFILSGVKEKEALRIEIRDLDNIEIFSDQFSPSPRKNLRDFVASLILNCDPRKILLFVTHTLEKLKLSSPEYYQLIAQLREHIPQYPKLTIDYGCWLSPDVIYFETVVDGCWILETTKILLFAPDLCQVTQARFFQISHNKIAVIAVFNPRIDHKIYQDYEFLVVFNQALILIEGKIHQKAYGLEFVEYLNSLSEHQRSLIRDTVNWGLIELTPKTIHEKVKKIIYKLQYFIKFQPTSLIDPNLPFNVYIDHCIPVGCEGVILWGWFQDAYQHLESIEAISDLGFSIQINRQQIYNFDRLDVNEYILKTRYQFSHHPLGFCAYLEIPEEIHQKLEGIGELHSFRFKFKVKGQIEINIIPDIKYYDTFTYRKMIMQIAPPEKITDETLKNCLGASASKLQKLCIQKVRAKELLQIKPSPNKPLASIIIPLYKQLDFIRVQLATMANDQDIQQSELIYVLDSPEQERQVKSLLQNHNKIYDLPIKLVIMERNGGYAAANNVGASYAESDYLVLMNSDVFPKSKGWLSKLINFYATSPQIGALAPKLIYEDQSLQHAGMFFEKTTFPFWITAHYYKGFPNRYQPAQKSRRVPAVTGACLMIKTDLYQQVGGFTTDYIIGDFEDSDLCFKCLNLGYESWYFADVELYHLERQSMILSDDFSGTLSWRYNAWVHHNKWNSCIENLMQEIPDY